MSSHNWHELENFNDYDYVVVGTGCTALAFVHEVLRNDPQKKVICLERGGFLLPTHFQNLSVPFRGLIGGDAETYPWTLSEKTHQSQLGYCHGYYPFFGGRSLFWSGWCSQPQAQALRDFPPAMHRAAADPRFWSQAREVLNVISTAEMEDPAFGALQAQLTNRLAHPLSDIPSLATSEPAMLAGGHRHKKAKTGFSKFCAAESLLSLVDQRHSAAHANEAPLRIGLNCTVKKIVMDGEEAVGVETSRGFFGLRGNRSKLVLCAGAVPNTTMLMNSIPRIRETAGKRLTGHFLSHISARVPVHADASPWSQNRSNSLEIAAQCLLGYHPVTKRQYQIQVTAVHCPSPEKDLEELARKCPDYSASAQVNQLRGSENHVLFCTSLQ
jgi:choline dehydrogenase-like flavoprotein